MKILILSIQLGARNIILTSRNGLESLQRRGDYIAERVLKHLQRCTDLSLQVVAADGTSQKEMKDLVDSIKRPLGGCALLAARLSDKMFISQTKESFECAFPPKVEAFHILENVIDIRSLDFFVSFSSISGLFGNAGQTNYAA